MIITPASCTTCQDGSATFTVTGPARPYEFRLSGPGIAVPTWSFGGVTDIPSNTNTTVVMGGKTKTYNGLLPGNYVLEVASDKIAGTRLCVSTITFEVPNLCPEPPDPNKCKPCGNMVNIIPKVSISASNPAKHVRFAHIPEYEIGTQSYTVEAWIKPLFNLPVQQTVTICTIQSQYGPATTLGEQVTTPAPFLYHNFRLVVEGGGFWFLFVSFAIDDVSNFGGFGDRFFKLSTNAITPFTDKPNHVVFVVRDIIEQSVTPTEDWQVDNTTTPLSNKTKFNKAISFYLNGVLIDSIHPDTLASVGPNEVTLTPADRLLLKDVSALNGYVVVGGRYHTMHSLDNGQITNFRWYARELGNSEIKTNYLKGCHGEPISCEDLLLYAPLDQPELNIVPELVNQNFGELLGYTTAETNINGGAWTIQCCPETKLNTSDFSCEEEPCGNALLIKPKASITRSSPAKLAKVSHINQYNVGEAIYSVEAWVQPLYTSNIVAETDVMVLHSPMLPTTSLAEQDTSSTPYLTHAFKIRYENGKYYMRFGASYDGVGSWKTVGPPTYGTFFVCTDQVQMSNSEANHCVWVVREILEHNAVPTQSYQIDNTQPNAVNKAKANAAVEFWLNGVLIDTLYPTDTFDIDNQNECILDSPKRLVLRNLDNLTGDITIGGRYYTMANAGNAKITNVRWYNRPMERSEIQTNYLLGCDAQPSNCSSLLMYLPLNQKKGAITQEMVYDNFGQLLGYTMAEVAEKGGAWTRLCCSPNGYLKEFTCSPDDCIPGWGEVSFTLDGGSAADSPFIIAFGAGIMSLVPGQNIDFTTCPLPATITDYFVYVPINPAIYSDAYSQAAYIVSYYNTLVGNPLAQPSVGPYAIHNLNKVIIRFPDDNAEMGSKCGQAFSVCPYNGTNTTTGTFDLTPYTGTTTITFPSPQTVKCCVNPDPTCDTNIIIG